MNNEVKLAYLWQLTVFKHLLTNNYIGDLQEENVMTGNHLEATVNFRKIHFWCHKQFS